MESMIHIFLPVFLYRKMAFFLKSRQACQELRLKKKKKKVEKEKVYQYLCLAQRIFTDSSADFKASQFGIWTGLN